MDRAQSILGQLANNLLIAQMTDRMPVDESVVLQTITSLDERARRASVVAGRYTIMIVFLGSLGILSFIYASWITDIDLSASPSEAAASIRSEFERLYEEDRPLQTDTQKLQARLSESLQNLIRSTPGLTMNDYHLNGKIASQDQTCCFLSLPTFKELGSALETFVSSRQPDQDGHDALLFTDSYGLNAVGALSKAQWLDLAHKIAALPLPLSGSEMDRFREESHQLGINTNKVSHDSDLLAVLASEIKVQSANSELHIRPDVKEQNSSNKLIQTSVTRFAITTLVIFLAGFFSNLQRYQVKLSGFYKGKADALRLHSEFGNRLSDFVLLSSALTPDLSFGKEPASPLADLADLLRSVRDRST